MEQLNQQNTGYFDVVIGNPPYIKEGKNKKAFDNVHKSPYYQGKMDLWYLFACYGIDFLKTGGLLCFIATNNWVTSFGANKLRNKVISDTKILKLVDFGNFKIFESASIQTMVMLFEKNNVLDNYYFDYRRLSGNTVKEDVFDLLALQANIKAEYIMPKIIKNELYNSFLTFNNKIKDELLDKIQVDCIKLYEKEIANGIHPHYDFINNKILKNHPSFRFGEGIFGLSEIEKESLKLTKLEKELVKPYYTTAEISRYYTDANNKLWIIYTDSRFKNPDSMIPYPNLKTHLDKFKGVITSDNKPYGLHRARDERFFKGEKIIVQRKCSDQPSFSYSDFDTYVSATFYVIKTNRFNLKYLTALLNSKLIEFWLRNKGSLQGNNFQLDKVPLLDIPIKTPSKYEESIIINMVDPILNANMKNQNFNTSEIESEINMMIFKIYNLNDDEIKIIEGLCPQ